MAMIANVLRTLEILVLSINTVLTMKKDSDRCRERLHLTITWMAE
jgi:hypothetical protein